MPIHDREHYQGFNATGLADSDLTRFRETNSLTNADLIMEVKYSNLESERGDVSIRTREREDNLDKIREALDVE